MQIKWVPNLKQNQILVPDTLIFPQNNLSEKKVLLKFGAWKKEVFIITSADFPENAIGLSPTLSSHFKLPSSISYELNITENTIELGPIIAFVAFKTVRGMKKRFLPRLEAYFKNYDQIKGLVFICASNSFNTKTKTVSGYYYCPDPQKKSSWHAGVFPYPGAIYRRKTISKKVNRDIKKTIGDRVFNTDLFNKWELWQSLSPYPEILNHMPHTVKLETAEDLENILELYDSVYLKRIHGLRGEGLIRARKMPYGYRFVNRFSKVVKTRTREELMEFIHQLQQSDQYIAQQGVPMTYQSRKVDFRVIMQKDHSKEWDCSGIIARFGKKGTIASNFTSAGYVLPGQDALRDVFQLSEEEALLKGKEITDICKKACKLLDETRGHYGDLGVDVIVDSQLKVWILEINKFHMHSLPLHIQGEPNEMFYKVVTTPFQYAKALTGF